MNLPQMLLVLKESQEITLHECVAEKEKHFMDLFENIWIRGDSVDERK